MCVIALVPAGQELTKEQAEAMWQTNPDGGGFGWLDRHNQWRIKTFMQFNDFWNSYKGTVQGYRDRDFLTHFRIGTHGFKDLSNCHPFRVDHNTIMAHNGIISCVPDYQDGRSDTRTFVEDTLPLLPKGWLDVPELRWLVEEGIGSSKLCFLTNDPTLSATTYILNKAAGKELENGIWVSNKLWEKHMPDNKPKVLTAADYNRPFSEYAAKELMWDHDHDNPLGGMWVPSETIGKQTWRPKPEPAEVANVVSTNSDIFKLKEMIEDRRNMDGLKHEIVMVDGSWECMGCFEPIGENAECECYDSVCISCYDYSAYCACNYDLRTPILIPDLLLNPSQYSAELLALSHLSEIADALSEGVLFEE